MEITSTQQGEITVIIIEGTVDALTAGDATGYLKDQVNKGNYKLVIDLTKVEYMSSAGLRTLLMILKQVRSTEGDLKLANPQDAVQKVLEMAGLTSIIDTYNDVEAAAAAFED